MPDESDYQRCFGGVARLYGDAGLACFRHAHLCVVGIGGVGSWVAEALARSGIGALTLIDMDHVSASNSNRQLVALQSTLGKAKALVAQQRILDINPACRVTVHEQFATPENLDELLDPALDSVIDCIDNFRQKAALISWCRRRKIAVVTVGGAGGKSDPTKLHITDLSRTHKDALLSRTRRELRQHYGFPRNPRRRFSVPAVYSTEEIKGEKGNSLNCGGLGSVTHVTATAGLFAVSKALEILCRRE
ncbi:MAG: tRNA threonylcarbamoyladenosine dehydratase [Pseudomonadota bacterium]